MVEYTDKIYGEMPVIVSEDIIIDNPEMMYWLYCPIAIPNDSYSIPDNLEQFTKLIFEAELDYTKMYGLENFKNSYIYITAKRMYVDKLNPGNRTGAHSDGFLTDDVNYIWCDKNPTEFWYNEDKITSPTDHDLSLAWFDNHFNYIGHRYLGKVNTLYRLDERVIHRVSPYVTPGIRTFVKISFSKHKYALKGNSINHMIGPFKEYYDRKETRNCPATN